MKFSVLIPAYNEEKYIERCIKSIPRQKNVEIIIGNDGSIDRTLEIILNLKKKDKRINYYTNWNNKGRAFIMNELLKEADGDIILKLDADMEIVSKDIFTKLTKIFKDPKVGGVSIFGHTKEIENQQKGFSKLEYKFYNYINKRKEEMLPIHNLSGLTRPLDIHCWRRKLVPNIPSDIIHDDGYAALEVLRQGYVIVKGDIIINHLKPPISFREMWKARGRGRKGWKQLEKMFGVKLKWGL